MTDSLMHVSFEEQCSLNLKNQSIKRSTCWVQRSLDNARLTSRMSSFVKGQWGSCDYDRAHASARVTSPVSILLSNLRLSSTSTSLTPAGTFWPATRQTMSPTTSEVGGGMFISPPSRRTTTWSGSRHWIDAMTRDVVNSSRIEGHLEDAKGKEGYCEGNLCGFGFPKGRGEARRGEARRTRQ